MVMAAFYPNSDLLYQAMQELFERIRNSTNNPVDSLSASRLVIRIQLSDPPAEITVNGRQRPVSVIYGSCAIRPDLDVSMKADILHHILKYDLTLKEAIANRQLKVFGPVWKTNSLANILSEGRALYPQVLKDLNQPCEGC